MANINQVDWPGLISKTLNTAIEVIARKVEGVDTSQGAAVSFGYSGITFQASKMMLTCAVIGTAIIGAVILLKRV